MLVEPLLEAGWQLEAAVDAVEALIRQHLERHAREHALPEPKRVPGPAALNDCPLIDVGDRRVQVVANLLHPRVIVFGGLLSARECEALIELARPRLQRSTVVDPVTGDGRPHEARTSFGAEYRPHYDYFDPAEPGNAVPLARGGQRIATLVMYLSTPDAGGATVFPESGFEVAAIRGNAVFFSYDRPHPMTKTLHGGAPVRAGEKWIATKWLRERAHR